MDAATSEIKAEYPVNRSADHRLGGRTTELTDEQPKRKPVKRRRTFQWTDGLTINLVNVPDEARGRKLSVLRPMDRRTDNWLDWQTLDLAEGPWTQLPAK